MTCIVALRREGRVHLASDSLIACGGSRAIDARGKLVQLGPVVMGLCGHLAALDAARYHLRLDPPKRGQRLAEWASVQLAGGLRGACRTQQALRDSDDDDLPDWQALVAYRGQFVTLGSTDLAVTEPLEPDYVALGSGAELAMGAMSVATGPPEKRLAAALEAAARHVVDVGPPWVFAHT